LTLGEANNSWLENGHLTEDVFPVKNHDFPASFVRL